MGPGGRSCVRCIYWMKTNLYKEGECRRRAPQANIPIDHIHKQLNTVWPHTMEDWWCGDFEVKPTPSPQVTVRNVLPECEAVGCTEASLSRASKWCWRHPHGDILP